MNSSIIAFGLMMLPLASAADQKERAGTPLLGYSFAPESRQLRAIVGVPGASSWSEAVPLPEGVDGVRVASGHRWALTSSEGGTGILVLDTLRHVRLDSGPVDDAIFSPSGGAVAIRRGDAFTVYAGLPDGPAQVGTFEGASGSIAISDTGEATASRDGRIARAASGELVMRCADCEIAYFPNSDALAILDNGRLVEWRGGEARVAAEGIPADFLRIAAGATRVALAGRDKLLVLERATGAIAAEEKLAGVDRLEALRLPGVWLLSAVEGSPAWLYASDAGVRFVPATRGVAGKDQE